MPTPPLRLVQQKVDRARVAIRNGQPNLARYELSLGALSIADADAVLETVESQETQ
jgi:hypothetical protein